MGRLREIVQVLRYQDSPTWVSYSDGRTGRTGEYIVSRRQQALHGLLRRRRPRAARFVDDEGNPVPLPPPPPPKPKPTGR